MSKEHIPVLLKEAIESLRVKKGGLYVDATLGAGGHAKAILELGGKVIGIDDDPKMLEIAKGNLESEKEITFVNDNFRNIDQILADLKINEVDGIIADLGVSSVHFDDDSRGFSFKDPDMALDMRLNPKKQGVTGAILLNSLNETQLKELLGGKLAHEIVLRRERKQFETVGDFLKACEVLGKNFRIHPATKAFMALRIAVNSEIDNLQEFLPKALKHLKMGGVVAVISFHSGEDEVVKEYSRELILPTEAEVKENVRARSAKLRIIKK